ncbi:hemerythrin domain-containing protein [Parapedobacter sp. 10938]|uniref:hemerythrin domain-containing protein n=1 Tax=Parapedobacter flavus TaxID=3110225 RepID=UPI002DBB237C|nr:hemerythrin domain-containing protein [Parapedobacter sp. 10938]MEC3881858.1 hemerythrin domain-containing protein [Parapedobacter sp. 10938]
MTDRVKPLKRDPHLKAVSRDHHDGLLLCWKIREGFKREIDISRIKRYTDWFWASHLVDHFAIEERYIFPILGADHELVKKALSEHRRLKRLFADDTEVWRSLNLIEEELDSHIRFEERVLFNEVQKVATAEQLALVDKHHNHHALCDDWEDEFWVKPTNAMGK